MAWWWAIAAVGLVVVSEPASAHACGSSLSPYWTFAESTPANDATELPRDVGIVLRATPWGPLPAGPSFPISSIVVVAEATGSPVFGAIEQWYPREPSVAWHPLVPLEPGQSYVLNAEIAQDVSRPAETVGSDSLTLRFTVGQELSAPLVLDGELTIDLSLREYVSATNCDNCGISCQDTETRTGVEARVTLPAVHGGSGTDGYAGWLRVTEDVPATFDGPGEGRPSSGEVDIKHYVHLAAGEVVDVAFEIPRGDEEPYRPCFVLNVWDPAGHSAETAPLCLDSADVPDSTEGTGCAVRGSSEAAGRRPWWIACAAACFAGALARRARKHT